MVGPLEDTQLELPACGFADRFFASDVESLPVEFGAATHPGKVRSCNEDQFAVLRHERSIETLMSSLDDETLVVVPTTESHTMVVVDGIGGMKSGEHASRLALQTMIELSGRATSWVMRLTDLDAQQIHDRVEAYVQRIHHALQEAGRLDPEKRDMGTTWTSAHLFGARAIIAHLGDSRAYRYRSGELCQITRDDTMAQELIDAGMEPASVSRFSHVLINSFGGGNERAFATIDELDLEPGDRLLLCTDGLSDMVPDDGIAAELGKQSDPQSICESLIEKALANGGKDNVTVVLAVVSSK